MFRLFDLMALTLERLRQQWVLVFWTLLGLTVASTLATSITLYIDAVNTRILDDKLGEPPFAYRFRYLGAWNGNIGPADYDTASATVNDAFVGHVGLPTARQVSFVRGQPTGVQLRPAEENPLMLGSYTFGALNGIEEQIIVTAGEWPPTTDTDSEVIPVLLPETFLYTMGIQVGDELRVQQRGGEPLVMQVAALWRPANENDPSWIFPPKFFDEVLIIPEEALWGIFEGQETPIEEAAWFLVFDGGTVRTSDIPAMLSITQDAERLVNSALPGVRMDVSPEDPMQAFIGDVRQLTQQLVIVVLPVGGVVVYFVSLVAGLLVGRQQNEDILLRSRGMGRAANMGLHTLQWGILVLVAFAIGQIAAPMLTGLVGQTTSFLRFDGPPGTLTVVPTRTSILAGLLTALLAASTGLVMAYRNTLRTIVQFKQAGGRSTTAWWQRIYLDLMLLVPGGYVLYTLSQQGGLEVEAQSPFADPLTFVGPTLFSLGATLLFLRVFPFMMRLWGGILTLTRNISLLMALRETTRARTRYQGTLFMMCFTLALTGFTASMANTIDRSLRDTIDYQTGADLVMVMASDAETEQGEINENTGQQQITVTGFSVLPVDNLWDVDDIYQFSRVGRYPARLRLPGVRLDGRIVGVDRAGLAAVTRYREDFADGELADIANQLAQTRNGVIVDRRTLEEQGLLLNQQVTVEIEAIGEWYEMRAQVVGVVDYFPTMDPADGFFLIANIDPVFETVGTPLPHNIWLRLREGVAVNQVQEQIVDLDYPVTRWIEPDEQLRLAQADPSRRGVLGFLSIGFIAATLLTLISTIIQSSASFRAQSSQIGALRAMGLSGAAVGTYVISLQGINTLGGILGGTGIGVGTTLLFLPLLDFSGGLPPYLVEVAWGQLAWVYGLFAGSLALITLVTTWVVSRVQISQVSRLGDV